MCWAGQDHSKRLQECRAAKENCSSTNISLLKTIHKSTSNQMKIKNNFSVRLSFERRGLKHLNLLTLPHGKTTTTQRWSRESSSRTKLWPSKSGFPSLGWVRLILYYRCPLNMFCPFVLTCRWPRKWLHWTLCSTRTCQTQRTWAESHQLLAEGKDWGCSTELVVRYKRNLSLFHNIVNVIQRHKTVPSFRTLHS